MKDRLSPRIVAGMSGNNTDPALGKRIRYLRKEVLGMDSQEEFAKAIDPTLTRGAVGNWELGKGIKRENLKKIADLYEISFDWLSNGTGDPPKNIPFGDNTGPTKAIPFDRRRGEAVRIVTSGGPALERNAAMLPVYSAAQGGKGHLIITIEAVDYRAPPAEILTARGAHGILVVGDSMIPAYRPGDIAWVTPHKPPQRDKDVVLYHGKPSGEAEAMIKHLVSFNDREWKLEQYNPPEEFTESRQDWPVCHQIHSKTNA